MTSRILVPLLSSLLCSAAVAAPSSIDPGDAPAPPAPRLRLFSFWGSVASASGSEAQVRQAGSTGLGGATDIGPFLLLGGRLEFYPSAAGRASRHFGVGIEIEGFAGEAHVETHPGLPAEEVQLTGGVVTPSFVARFGRASWEAYGGVGTTLLWVTRLGGASRFSPIGDDTDGEAPLGLALFAGVRRVYPGRWFFMIEARHRTGKNDFTLSPPVTQIDLDWRMTGIAAGTGYAF